MPQILFIRHSKSVANVQGIMAGGLTDSPLSNEGIELAHQKGRELRAENFKPTDVFTSTLLRTEQTASIILKELGLQSSITQIPSFNERGFGDYDGKPFHLLLEAFEKLGPNPPTVEDSSDFVERVMGGFEEVQKIVTTTALIVTHYNVLSAIHCALYDSDKISEFWETYEAKYCEGFTYYY